MTVLLLALWVQSGQWSPISEKILTELYANRPAQTDPYATVTAGISVDRTNGDVYMLANNIGICKSTDQGKTFRLVSGNAVTGRFETGYGLNIDPNGKRIMCFTIYGSSAYSPDSGRSWIPSKQGHLDYGAVDWTDTGHAFLSIGHESGGKLLFSTDTGQSWQTLGTNYWAVGLFDHRTLVAARESEPGIFRSPDGGQSWTKVSDEPVATPVMVEFKGVGYWIGKHGLLMSRDKGLTWSTIGSLPTGAALGPMFGRDVRHLVVGAADGLYRSDDQCRSWAKVASLEPDIKILPRGKYGTYGWDPLHNVFYASQMRLPAYRYPN